MAKKLYWLKRTAILQDPKMVYVLSKGAVYYVIWQLIQDVAASIHDAGRIYISPQTPMDAAFLAKCIGQKRTLVEKALTVLTEIELIGRDDSGHLQLLNWDELQDFDKYEKEREQTRRRVAAHRERKAAAAAADDPDMAAATPAPVPAPPESDLRHAVSRYQQYWGNVNPAVAQKLSQLTQDWGSDSVCQAIDIAREKGKRHLNYIQAILVNSNGRPQGKEQGTDEESISEYVDRILCEVEAEEAGKGKYPPPVSGAAGYERTGHAGPLAPVAAAL